jgi:hypothetical protein
VISDERIQEVVLKSEIKTVFDEDVPEDIPIATVMEKLREQYHVFYIHPRGGSYLHDSYVTNQLKQLFGERYVNENGRGSDENLICETIIGLIAATEGADVDDIIKGLTSVGTDEATARAVSNAVVPYGGGRAVAKKATATGELATAGAGDDVGRL